MAPGPCWHKYVGEEGDKLILLSGHANQAGLHVTAHTKGYVICPEESRASLLQMQWTQVMLRILLAVRSEPLQPSKFKAGAKPTQAVQETSAKPLLAALAWAQLQFSHSGYTNSVSQSTASTNTHLPTEQHTTSKADTVLL